MSADPFLRDVFAGAACLTLRRGLVRLFAPWKMTSSLSELRVEYSGSGDNDSVVKSITAVIAIAASRNSSLC